MNAENFSEYLKNPSQLYQISYQELKSLVLQYPYSPNLRYLLMRKAKMENNDEYDRLLSLASTYSIDRSFLFKKMKADRLIPEFEENYELNEEYLELKDLAALEVEAELVENFIEDTTAHKADELAFALDDLVEQPENIASTPSPSIKKEDNLSDGETESLLERLLDGEFVDVEAAQQHEALNNLSLADISKVADTSENDAVEEKIIENSLEELAEKSDLIQQFEAGTNESEIQEEVPTAKSDDETVIKTEASFADELEQHLQESEVKTLDDSDIDIEEEGQIFEQERFPDLELKSLDKLANTNEKVAISSFLDEELGVFEDKNSEAKPAAISEIVTENEEAEEDNKEGNTVSLSELSKKSSEKPERLKTVIEDSYAPKPLPKSSFNSWLKQYKSPLLDSKIDDIKEKSGKKPKKKKGKKKESQTRVIAKASVQEDLEIATETLASLLEKQEHYSRAIRMYETLRLRNPEKNAFFAAKIEALQKLRDEE